MKLSCKPWVGIQCRALSVGLLKLSQLEQWGNEEMTDTWKQKLRSGGLCSHVEKLPHPGGSASLLCTVE